MDRQDRQGVRPPRPRKPVAPERPIGELLQVRDATTACRDCGTALHYREMIAFPSIKPGLCDRCADIRDTQEAHDKERAVRVAREASAAHLRYRSWDPKAGNTATLDRIMRVAFVAGVPAGKSMYVTGDTDLCKTRAVCEAARVHIVHGGSVWMLAASEAHDMYRRNIMRDAEAGMEFKAALARYPGVLIIDDIGVGKDSERTAELWYEVSDRRLDPPLPTWWTSNLSLERLDAKLGPEYGPRIVRRIAEACVVIEVSR